MWGRWPLRRWFRVLWCLLALSLVVALPLLIIDFKRTGYSLHDQVCVRACACLCVCVCVCVCVLVWVCACVLAHVPLSSPSGLCAGVLHRGPLCAGHRASHLL